MKIGILCGIAASAQRKAEVYQEAILAAGHSVNIFSRGPIGFQTELVHVEPNLQKLGREADHIDCDFYIGCNDNLGDLVTLLNKSRNMPHIPLGATDKTNLDKLSDKLQPIPSWDHLDKVPNDIPIFVKPSSGSGSVGGEPWSYKKFESKRQFVEWLDTIDGGWHRFEYAQEHVGVLGRSVFQQYIENNGFMYMHYMNDGTPKLWMESFCHEPRYSPTWNKIHSDDAYDFTHNVPWGTFCSFQAFPNPNGKPYVFDFNVRVGAYWTTLFEHLSPDFFKTYFDNLLNNKQGQYEYKCTEFVMDENGPEHLKVEVIDFPASGVNSRQALILK